MKVKDLIKQLQQQDPEKEVAIQQGEDYDYTVVRNVQEVEIWNAPSAEEDDTYAVVAIQHS